MSAPIHDQDAGRPPCSCGHKASAHDIAEDHDGAWPCIRCRCEDYDNGEPMSEDVLDLPRVSR